MGAILLVVLGLPSAVGGLALYFEYGRRRALAAALANLTVVLAFAAVNRALGNGGGGGGGMPPPASVR